MGKNNSKKKGNKNMSREDDFDYDKMNAMRQNNGPRKNFNNDRGPRQQQEKVEHPVARLLCDTISGQILDVLNARVESERTAAIKDVFNLGYYPAQLAGIDEAQDYEAYQLERTARVDKIDPSKLNRMTTSIVVMNKITKKPAFFVTAYITPQRKAMVVVYEQGEKGTNYRNTVRWVYEGL